MGIQASDLIAKFQRALDEKWGYIWGTAGVMWTEARQRAIETTTDADRESARKNGAKWIGHRVADCSGMFSWAFKELGGYMYHGSNTMWDRYCTARGKLSGGKRTDGQALRPGTAVFCYNEKTGRRSHVGLFIGGGYVIEASGTLTGVIKSQVSNKKWEEWGELKGVIFDQGGEDVMPDNSEKETRPTIKRGSKGDCVRMLQEKLVAHGYDVGSAGIDGDFGRATHAAVTRFQMDNGLAMDGIVGPATWAKLDEAQEIIVSYSVTINGLTKAQAASLLHQYPGSNVTEERR